MYIVTAPRIRLVGCGWSYTSGVTLSYGQDQVCQLSGLCLIKTLMLLINYTPVTTGVPLPPEAHAAPSHKQQDDTELPSG